jgi:hypothetical protein
LIASSITWADHLILQTNTVYLGKCIDADELQAYRSANTDATYAWIKRSLLIGTSVATAILVVLGINSFSSRKQIQSK